MSELAETETSNSILAVISRAASDQAVDVDKMERLLNMQERVMKESQSAAYNRDMAMMQAEMPTIARDGKITVNNEVRSTYARFEDIVEQTKPLLAKYGFSVTFQSNVEDSRITVTGTMAHREGHSVTTSLPLPFDSSGSKNTVQAIGSSISYGKRYVFGMLTNVVTGEDDDGVAADPGNTLEKQFERVIAHNDVLRDNLPTVLAVKEYIISGELSSAKEAWHELSQSEQGALWLATTKGGIFSTEERRVMKSNEWGQA